MTSRSEAAPPTIYVRNSGGMLVPFGDADAEALYGLPRDLFAIKPRAVKAARRTIDQNNKLWPLLGDLAEQVVWFGQKLEDHEWKDVVTAELKKSRIVPGISGQLVTTGLHTRKLTKDEFSDLLEIILSFGAGQGVRWTGPKEPDQDAA